MSDLLKCEIEHLQQTIRTLLEGQERLMNMMGADIARLEAENAQLLAALRAADAVLARRSPGVSAEQWKAVRDQVRDAITPAEGGAS
jgi:hypothetical protein